MAQFCNYEIIGEVGRGGMGAVYRARHKDGRIVALKVMRPEFRSNASAEKRFRRAPQLYPKHANIVEIYDSGECDGTLFFAMQLIEGESLSGVLRRVRVFTPEQYAPIFRDVAAGLDASHAKGVIHRDIKPSNILVRNSDGRAFLTDFDIAKDLTAGQFTSVAGAGGMIGTAHYMSPEQASGKPITPASDVYSLGAMTYEALAGHPPFMADSEFVVARMHLQDPPVELFKANPAVSEKVSAVVMKALNKDPRARYASAGAFSQAFVATLDKKRATALPRWLALAGGLATLLVVAVLAIALISASPTQGNDATPVGNSTQSAGIATATRKTSTTGTRVVSKGDTTAVDSTETVETPTPDTAPGLPTVTPDLRVMASATPRPFTPVATRTAVPDAPTSAPTNVAPTSPPEPTSAPPPGPTSAPPPGPTSPPPPTTAPTTPPIIVVRPPVLITAIIVRPPIIRITPIRLP